MYLFYIVMKIYVLVYTNIGLPICFLCIIIMLQPSSYHRFYTFINYVKTFEDSISFINLLYKTFQFYNKLFSSSESVFKGPKHSLIYQTK
jgi:hypothetical protein